MLAEYIKEILRHTKHLTLFDMVKLIGEEDGSICHVHSVSEDRAVILRGELINPDDGLVGHTVGLARLNILNGYSEFPVFQVDDAEIKIHAEERNGVTEPTGIKFSHPKGNTAIYRFTSKEYINSVIDSRPFSGADWDVTFTPEVKTIKEMSYFSNLLVAYEASFNFVAKGNTLYANIGTDGMDGSLVPILEQKKLPKIDPNRRWLLRPFLGISRLMDAEKCEIRIDFNGIINIELVSEMGVYQYYLLAKG